MKIHKCSFDILTFPDAVPPATPIRNGRLCCPFEVELFVETFEPLPAILLYGLHCRRIALFVYNWLSKAYNCALYQRGNDSFTVISPFGRKFDQTQVVDGRMMMMMSSSLK